jgi:hypothetical protein
VRCEVRERGGLGVCCRDPWREQSNQREQQRCEVLQQQRGDAAGLCTMAHALSHLLGKRAVRPTCNPTAHRSNYWALDTPVTPTCRNARRPLSPTP